MTTAARRERGEPRLKLLLVGVGGQGVLSAAGHLAEAALASGINVVVGQLHGMSQRGGSVESAVLLGPGQSAFIEDGAADVVVALEPLEALRARTRMSPATRLIVNLGRVVPFTLAQSGDSYPAIEEILAPLRAVARELMTVDGPALIEEAGVTRALNIVMLGALSGLSLLPFDADTLWRAIERRSPPRFVEGNRRAFALGRRAAGAEEAA